MEGVYVGGYLAFSVAAAELVSCVPACGIAQSVGFGTISLVFFQMPLRTTVTEYLAALCYAIGKNLGKMRCSLWQSTEMVTGRKNLVFRQDSRCLAKLADTKI